MKRLLVGAALFCLMAGPGQVMAAGKKVSADDTQRAKYAAQISKKWAAQIKRKYGMSSAEWTEQMMGTFAGSDLANMKRAAEAQSFDGMSGALFGGSSAANMALTRPTVVGSVENDLVFTPLPPCRIVDTRLVGGMVKAQTTRKFLGWSATNFASQGGSDNNCGVPENASAIVANVVAVNPVDAKGYVTLWPSDVGKPQASALNLVGTNIDVANQIALKLCRPGCDTQFSVYSNATLHLVVDVYGYYMEPVATPLDCTVASKTGTLLNLNLNNVNVSCPASYTAMSGGCSTVAGVSIQASNAVLDTAGRPTGWNCGFLQNLLGALLGYTVQATCCRVPGR